MSKHNAEPFTKKVLKVVAKRGPCTIAQVVAALGNSINANTAMRKGQTNRRYDNKFRKAGPLKVPPNKLIEQGKLALIGQTLAALARSGQLRRVSKGVYALPEPKPLIPADEMKTA